MKKYIILITIIVLLLNITIAYSQSSSKISPNDLKPLIGDWKGALTYIDYTSNMPYSMPADLSISKTEKPKVFIVSNIYPDEPKANSTDTLIISKNGKMLNEAKVKSKRKLKNGNTEIIAEYSGIDGNDEKPALIKITYNFGKATFSKTKDVQFEGQDKWIKRHVYSFTRR